MISVAAIHVLKNELASLASEPNSRRLLFERTFTLPGRWGRRANLMEWVRGGGAERFRDDCDRCFWEEVVPPVSREFDRLAEPFLNTINEVIINYAEYSFRRWALWKHITAQIFLTDDHLAYGIVRPHGLGQRVFDPLSLREKRPGALSEMRRGWGHTLLMRRALFISFDHSPSRRGMMVVVGPD